ncbi:MAG: DUF2029 domain-containing protein [Firmicutes bacterium]|nr:DUF2029 domain-containing protein [Bacillota bacterium]
MKNPIAKIRTWEIPWPVVLITGLVMLFLYISCSSGDLWITGNSAWKLWDSHFYDFYETVTDWQGIAMCNYLPTTYILFGIWILPLKLLGFAVPETVGTVYLGYVWWYKALPVALFGASIPLVYRICQMAGFGKTKASWAAFAYATAPVAIFSQFIFSQYDIFTVFLVLLALYFWMQDKEVPFIACIAVATTIKYYAAIFGLVFLLLKEKRVLWVLIKAFGIISLFALYMLIFYRSETFKECVFGFFVLDYVNAGDFTTGLGSISFTQIMVAVLAAWAYFTKPEDQQGYFKWAIYLSCGVCFAFFGLSSFHPQWLLMGVPFWTMAMFMHRQGKVFPWLDLLFAVCYYLFTFIHWRTIADNVFIYHGIWQYVLNGRALLIHNADIIPFHDSNLLYTLMVALIVIYFIFNHPKYSLNDLNVDAYDWKKQRWVLYARGLIGPALYVVPTALCLIMTMMQPPLVVLSDHIETWYELKQGESIEQIFTARYDTLDGIYLTFQEEAEDDEDQKATVIQSGGAIVRISDPESEELLFEEFIKADQIDGNTRLFLDTNDLPLIIGKNYQIAISGKDKQPAFLAIGNIRGDMNLGNYAVIDGEPMTGNLCIDMLYDK